MLPPWAPDTGPRSIAYGTAHHHPCNTRARTTIFWTMQHRSLTALAPFALLCPLHHAHAQTFQWARTLGSAGYEIATAVRTAPDGSVYSAGYAAEDPISGCGATAAPGGLDLYLSKHDPNGNCLWSLIDGGPGGDEVAYGLATDAAGNVYAAGSYSATATFGSAIIVPSGMEDLFVVKYDAGGTFQWLAHAGGPFGDEARAVAVDTAGNVYVCGSFKTTATFGAITIGSVGNRDLFLAKLSPAGVWLWARRAGGAGGEEARGVAVDEAGDIHLTGWCSSSPADFGPFLVNPANADLFVAKYDGTGQCLWVRIGGGNSTDQGQAIAVDQAGNSYTTGWISGDTAFFDGVPVVTNGPFEDVVLASYDPSGALRWVRHAGGLATDQGAGIDLNEQDGPVLTGNFSDTITIGGTTLIGAGGIDVFVAGYDTAGTALWALSGGGAGYDPAGGAAVGLFNETFIAGGYDLLADFGTQQITAVGSSDHYLAKVGQLPTGTPLLMAEPMLALSWDRASHTLDLFDPRLAGAPCSIADASGRILHTGTIAASARIDLPGLRPGLYVLRIAVPERPMAGCFVVAD